MKRMSILCVLILTVVVQIYPEMLSILPDLVKPSWLRVDNRYIYVSDRHSVFIYDRASFGLVKKIGKRGEGPGEFKSYPKILFKGSQLVLADAFKLIEFSADLTLIKETNFRSFTDRIIPVEDNWVLKTARMIDKISYNEFALYDDKFKKLKVLAKPLVPKWESRTLIMPHTVARSWKGRIYIAQPEKGFYIEVFDNNGRRLFHIEKQIKKVKFEEKHRKLYEDGILLFVGRRLFDKSKARGVFKKPMGEFVPDINSFWVTDDRLYVKTFDITQTTEKYIIMDLKGITIKKTFLPKAYRELLAFHNNIFYYLEDNEIIESWELHAVKF